MAEAMKSSFMESGYCPTSIDLLADNAEAIKYSILASTFSCIVRDATCACRLSDTIYMSYTIKR